MIIIYGVASAMQMLPGDGTRLTIYRLDTKIEESHQGLYDLSEANITEMTEMCFEYHGDSLVRCIAGQHADWLRITGDTIWHIGTDTRHENARYRRGVPYLLPCRDADTHDTVRHDVFMSIDREDHIACRYSSGRSVGFVLPGGDTIPSTYCVATEVSDRSGIVHRRQWYAEGAIWPVVVQVTTTAEGEEYTEVNICPITGQTRPRAAVKGKSGHTKTGGLSVYDMLSQLHRTDPAPTPSTVPTCDQEYAVTIDPQGIKVTGPDSDRATVRLFDASGRQWHEGPAAATISTSHLAEGVYLLQISSVATTKTLKIHINIR